MTVVTPIPPAEQPAGFPHGSGNAAVPAAREADGTTGTDVVRQILAEGTRTGRLTHLEEIPGRAGEPAEWPEWVPAPLTAALAGIGIAAPWRHQVTAADH